VPGTPIVSARCPSSHGQRAAWWLHATTGAAPPPALRRSYAPGAHSVGSALVQKLDAEGVNFLQFAFRWVNCLLVREVPFALGARLWDTYLAEGNGMGDFLVRGGGAMAWVTSW